MTVPNNIRRTNLQCISKWGKTEISVVVQWLRLHASTAREGNGTPLQCSCLENPKDRGAWWAAVHGVPKSRTWLSDFTFTFHFHALEKEMATHSSVLAWRIPGTAEPGGLLSVRSHRVGHDWSDAAAAAAAADAQGNAVCSPGWYILSERLTTWRAGLEELKPDDSVWKWLKNREILGSRNTDLAEK